MGNQTIAYCGLACDICPAYIATQAGDREALERVAEKWRQEFNAPAITADSILCDGCLSGPRKCGHCAECDIRLCGVERGVVNCAYCADYASCEKIQGFFRMVPEARTNLEAIRLKL